MEINIQITSIPLEDLLVQNENKLLNLDSKTTKDFAWAISYGLGYVYTDYFYVNDYDKSYELEK